MDNISLQQLEEEIGERSLLSFLSHYLDYPFYSPVDFSLIESKPWQGHVVFADMLMRSYRPQLLVELGTYTGVSFFAFCEAVRSAWLDTRCVAVDTWQGDEQSGLYTESVYASVAKAVEERYQECATLMRMTFDEAVLSFEDESIDVLHIDGLHTYEAVRHDFETWLGKVKPGGIILFHDIAEQREGYGAWKFWLEVARLSKETCRFPHSHGLGVWRKPGGPELENPFLRGLLSPETNTSRALLAIVQLFARQIEHKVALVDLENQHRREMEEQRRPYEMHVAELELHSGNLENQIRMLEQRIGGLEQHIRNLETIRTALEEEHARMLASRSWRITRPLRVLANAWRNLRNPSS